MSRDRILFNHAGFLAPLRLELEARGLKPVYEAWRPAPEVLKHSLACFVWFYDCLRHPLKVWRLKQHLSRYGVPLVAWNQDAPHYLNRKPWRLNLLDMARLLDVYATHTLIDDKRTFADLVLYLPNACNVASYNLRGEATTVLSHLRDPGAYRWDVSFFGGMNGARYKEDAARTEFFAALAERLNARGISHCFRETAGMSADEQVAFIHGSRINLNFGARCEYRAPVASGLPERCYGIPACGGFLLCDKRSHAADDFMPGENWAEFDGVDDCVAKIDFWLGHFDAARDVAERCYHHVMARHTYAHRAEKLHQTLLAWHAGQRGLVR